jgi:hypothetical protein
LEKMALFSQRQLGLGAPDSVRCARPASVNWLLSGSDQRRTAINHRTVWWCTGLSGEPTVGRANGRTRNPRATRGRANGQKGAPDCPVCTGLGPVRQRLGICNGRLRQIRKEIRTGQCPVRQATEGKNCLLEMLSTAPSCLGAIKATPRCMEENTKHPLSIVDHSHFILAHLFNILSDLSSVLVRTLRYCVELKS